MRITNESDYALRIVMELSKPHSQPDHGEFFSAALISKTSDVSLRFALKILRKLSLAGIVQSKKGAAGGYCLAKEPCNISFGEVIEAIQGPINLLSCSQLDIACPMAETASDTCRIYGIFSKLTQNFRQQLESIKFSDIFIDIKE